MELDDSTVDLVKLIGLIKARPALWDKINLNHRNNTYIQKVWLYIAREMKLPRSVVNRKWKSLRDRFRVEVKKILARDDAEHITWENMKTLSAWQYFPHMYFLRKHLANLPKKDIKLDDFTQKEEALEELESFVNEDSDTFDNEHYIQVKTYDEQEEDDDISMSMLNSLTENEVQFEQLDIHTGTPTTTHVITREIPATVVASTPAKSHTTGKNTSYDAKILEYLERSTNLMERDEDRAFFDSLLPHMARLEPSQKLLCRMDIQNIVYKYVYNGGVEVTD